MTRQTRDELVFVPLGGVGEIGMNMAAYGFGPANDRKWIVVDCGVTFGGPDLPGIELVMPDPGFLENQADNVLALIITHAHEDHYGAVLDLWSGFEKPVYVLPFTKAMLAAKRIANKIVANVDMVDMAIGKPFQLGPFKVEPINMAHSIPESCALLIETSVGRALHTGDWKLDPTPLASMPTDEKRLREVGALEGGLALICDSTNVLKDGVSPSETEISQNLTRVISEAKERVAVTTFASNLGRIVSIARAAHAAGREVVLAGRALHRVTTIARELGMMDDVPPMHDQDMFDKLPRDKVVLLCTGSQGEPRAAIARIAGGTHPMISLGAGDTMIFSSWAIPGNERAVGDIQNRLTDLGVKVITNADEVVHVTGHPRRDEVRQLYDWMKPDVLVPVHGEAVHLVSHAELGKSCGIADVLPARNGDMVTLFPKADLKKEAVSVGELYLDSEILCTPEESGVKGRRRLAFGGFVAVSVCLNKHGEMASQLEVFIEGVPELEGEDETPESIVRHAVKSTLRSMPAKRRANLDTATEAMRRSVRGELSAYWGRKANVKVFVHKV